MKIEFFNLLKPILWSWSLEGPYKGSWRHRNRLRFKSFIMWNWWLASRKKFISILKKFKPYKILGELPPKYLPMPSVMSKKFCFLKKNCRKFWLTRKSSRKVFGVSNAIHMQLIKIKENVLRYKVCSTNYLNRQMARAKIGSGYQCCWIPWRIPLAKSRKKVDLS